MKIVNAGFQRILELSPTKKIEQIARICYKSEDKIGEGTDVKMIRSLVKRGHLAMLEHAEVCLEVSEAVYDFMEDVLHVIENNLAEVNEESQIAKRSYLRRTATALIENDDMRFVISGNLRAWYDFFVEAAPLGAIMKKMYDIVNDCVANIFREDEYLSTADIGIDPEIWEEYDEEAIGDSCMDIRLIKDVSTLTVVERMVHETISVLFTVDRGVTHEMVRHRDCSFAQESTRYCNYSSGKHGNEITVIEPCFFAKPDTVDLPTEEWSEQYGAWHAACKMAEDMYIRLLNSKATPQEARSVLPSSTKAEIVMTANLREWRHILSLRACDSTGPAHPQMHEVMCPLLVELRPEYAFAFGDLKMPHEI